MMKRRDFFKTTAAAATPFLLPGCFKPGASGKKPNVILIITDDQGYGDLSCHGNPILKTPAMDALFAESVRLTDFHVGPTCAPTRASLMTGRYCNRTGVWHTVMGRSLLRRDEVTLGDVFRENGYRTGIFGKWHLGDNAPYSPHLRGFDESVVHGGGGVGQIPDYWDNDYFDDFYWHNGAPRQYTGYCTDIWFREAKRFIQNNQTRPFFCYLSTNAPHGPLHVEKKHYQPYIDAGVPEWRARFFGMIANIDENLAALRKELQELDLEEDTIFIFMTDNGTAGGATLDENGLARAGFNAGMRGTKGSEYDGGHRVPFFIRWPAGGIQGGKDVKHLTAHVDVLPTLAGLCGLSLPETCNPDGKSIQKLLGDPSATWPERLLVTDSQRVDQPVKWRKSAVMSDRWRLVNGKEMYDMSADPGQQNNIAEAHPEEVSRMREFYESWWADVSERFDESCDILLGSEDENPVRLTCHDWHNCENPEAEAIRKRGGEVNPPWNQPHVRGGMVSNGEWSVEVVREGEYTISLYRWAPESGLNLHEAAPGGGPIPGANPYPAGRVLLPVNARVRIGGVEKTKKVQGDRKAVTFNVRLKKGKTDLKTWLINPDGSSFGAYYVVVKRLS